MDDELKNIPGGEPLTVEKKTALLELPDGTTVPSGVISKLQNLKVHTKVDDKYAAFFEVLIKRMAEDYQLNIEMLKQAVDGELIVDESGTPDDDYGHKRGNESAMGAIKAAKAVCMSVLDTLREDHDRLQARNDNLRKMLGASLSLLGQECVPLSVQQLVAAFQERDGNGESLQLVMTIEVADANERREVIEEIKSMLPLDMRDKIEIR